MSSLSFFLDNSHEFINMDHRKAEGSSWSWIEWNSLMEVDFLLMRVVITLNDNSKLFYLFSIVIVPELCTWNKTVLLENFLLLLPFIFWILSLWAFSPNFLLETFIWISINSVSFINKTITETLISSLANLWCVGFRNISKIKHPPVNLLFGDILLNTRWPELTGCKYKQIWIFWRLRYCSNILWTRIKFHNSSI